KELRRFLKTGNGKYAVYQERLIAVCLCQGAAKHFLDQQTGVKDIDIWFFFEEHDLVRISNFRNARKSLVLALPRFGTKRIDIMKKSVPQRLCIREGREGTIRNYLDNANTEASTRLSEKPVIGLYPQDIFGRILCEGSEWLGGPNLRPVLLDDRR